MAQEISENSKRVEQSILAVNLLEPYDDAFINRGLSICNDYNSLSYDEKMYIGKDVMEKYDAVLKRVAFVLQQRINNIITSQQPISDLFQPTMELNTQIAQLQWNYQQKIINLDQFEQLRVNIRESYLREEFIPNYYIREQIIVTEDDFLSYQQTVKDYEPVIYPSSSEVVSQPAVSTDTPVLVTSSNPLSNGNSYPKPILPTVPEASTSSQLNNDESFSSTSPESTSSEVVSSESVSSATSDITSSEEVPLNDDVPESTVSTPDSGLIKPVGTIDTYGDINLVAVYIMAAIGALAAIALSSVIIMKSR